MDVLRDPHRIEIDTPRGQFSALRWPGDGRPLVFCHATGFNAETYRQLLGQLNTTRPIVAPDARGHGLSRATADPSALRSWTPFEEDLKAIINVLGGTVDLAGHSLGSIVGMRVAAECPELVHALTMIEPVLPPPKWIVPIQAMRALGLHGRLFPLVTKTRRRRATWPSKKAILEGYSGRGAFATWDDSWIADYVAGGTHRTWSGEVRLTCEPAWEAQTFQTTPYNSWGHLGRVRCPLTILYGVSSHTFPKGSALEAKRRLPEAHIQCFEPASHFLPMERPAEIAALLAQPLTR